MMSSQCERKRRKGNNSNVTNYVVPKNLNLEARLKNVLRKPFSTAMWWERACGRNQIIVIACSPESTLPACKTQLIKGSRAGLRGSETTPHRKATGDN